MSHKRAGKEKLKKGQGLISRGAGAAGARRRKRALDKAISRRLATESFRLRAGRRLASVFANLKPGGGALTGKAQIKLAKECLAITPDRKKALRAWREGGRFEHEPKGEWAGMYLSSVRGGGIDDEGRDKAWLWDAMAWNGADLWQADSKGMGFEARAVSAGDARALRWWRSRGFGIERGAGEGRSLWALALERAPRMISEMASLWPEEASVSRVGEELYGLARDWAKEGQGMMRRMGMIQAMREWPEELERRPELIRPSSELSLFMRSMPASGESVQAVERLERQARVRAEREALDQAAAPAPGRERKAGL